MKKNLLALLLYFSLATYSQNGITFSVETLSPPKEALHTRQNKVIWERLILSDMNIPPYKVKNYSDSTIHNDINGHKIESYEKYGIEVPFNIVAQSKTPDSLVCYGYHSFFQGMYEAYANHRPFVLSPDMMWLLISQGFARHINANPEKMRHLFVKHSGKLALVVPNGEVTLDNPNSPWDKIFPQLTKQIAASTGDDLINLLTADFSTTTSVERVASQITIMEAMKPYFEFVVMRIVCGIPEITLTGTPEDWQKVLEKTKKLSDYDLKWWTKEIEPLLKEFVKTSKGDVDKRFWRNMFKCHSEKEYGAPDIINGWIVKFFPYDERGMRNNLKQLVGGNSLPEEIVKVDLKYVEKRSDSTITTPLELWAGFIGLEQNPKNFTLKPVIGWMIRKKNVTSDNQFRQELESKKKSSISIKVKEVPAELLEMKEINRLGIQFADKIVIPDELAKVKIGYLELFGKISEKEIRRIKNLFPNTDLIINKKTINLKAINTDPKLMKMKPFLKYK